QIVGFVLLGSTLVCQLQNTRDLTAAFKPSGFCSGLCEKKEFMRLKTRYSLGASALFLAGAMMISGARPRNSSYEWSSDTRLLAPRSGACAAMLPDGSVLITGAQGTTGTLTSSEIFRSSGQVVSAPPMTQSRADHVCASLPDGRLLVAGGSTDGGGVTNAAEVFNPETQTWSAIGVMVAARSGATASV